MKLTIAQRKLLLNTLGPECNNGYFRAYSGTAITNAGASIAGNTLLFEGRFGATAFGAATGTLETDDALITANAMTGDASADAAGTPTFVLLFKSDGTTRVGLCTIGTSGSGAECIINVVPTIVGQPVNITSFTIKRAA